MSKFKFNPGDKIGPLSILMIERTNKAQDGHWWGIFQCPYCGQNFETRISAVSQGTTKSCGCLHVIHCKNIGANNIKDLSGQRFGKLMVEELTDKRNNSGSVIWKSRCDCGNIKYISSNDLQSGRVNSCGCVNSHGESKIQWLLEQYNINFIAQHSFKDCVSENNRVLRFDFYLPDYNCCIEYAGKQHFSYTGQGWNTKENFDKTRKHDKLKDDYCKQHSIYLIRIPYTDFNLLNAQYLIDLLKKI